jgi:hypothetical protein
VQSADFVLKLRHHQLMTAAELAIAVSNRPGGGFDAAADLLDIVTSGQNFQPFHLLAELEVAITPAAGNAFGEYLHGSGRILQILAHARHLLSRLVAIVAEFPAQRCLHRIVVLGCGRLAALGIEQLQALPEIIRAVRIQLHRVFRRRFNGQSVALGQGLPQLL